jgi:hypothetical protein
VAGLLQSIRSAQRGASPLSRRGPECHTTRPEMLRHASQMVHPAIHPTLHHRGASHPTPSFPRRGSQAEPQQFQLLREHESLPKRRRERVRWLGVLMRVLERVHGLSVHGIRRQQLRHVGGGQWHD